MKRIAAMLERMFDGKLQGFTPYEVYELHGIYTTLKRTGKCRTISKTVSDACAAAGLHVSPVGIGWQISKA
jgi:hypothetical protein